VVTLSALSWLMKSLKIVVCRCETLASLCVFINIYKTPRMNKVKNINRN